MRFDLFNKYEPLKKSILWIIPSLAKEIIIIHPLETYYLERHPSVYTNIIFYYTLFYLCNYYFPLKWELTFSFIYIHWNG